MKSLCWCLKAFLVTLLLVPGFLLLHPSQAFSSGKESPLGLYGMYKKSMWQAVAQEGRTVAKGPYAGMSWLEREYARFAASGASFITWHVPDLRRHLEDYRDGRSTVQVMAVGGFLDPGETAWPWDSRIPQFKGGGRLSFSNVIKTFSTRSDWRENLPLARRLHGEMAASLTSDPGLLDGLNGILLLDEGWREPDELAAYEAHVAAAIEEIRHHNEELPIAIINSATYLSRHKDERVRGFFDDVVTGERMAGWNVFMEDFYPYVSYHRVPYLEDVSSYAGPYYYRRFYLDYVIPLRETRLALEEYAGRGNWTGSDPPELWKVLQTQRGYFRQGEELVLKLRRPTQNEFSAQAFSAAACGATGFVAYNYFAVPPQRLETPRHLAEAGLISASWLEPGDPVEDFRKPYSRREELRDFTDPNELYRSEYPFDALAETYRALGELLPILRNQLRWWWVHDGVDRSFMDEAGSGNHWHTSLSDTMHTARHGGVPLAERFRLRALRGETERELTESEGTYASPVIVGLFDDPRDPLSEYYHFVNLHANEAVGNRVVDAPGGELLTLSFQDGQTPKQCEILWRGGIGESGFEGVRGDHWFKRSAPLLRLAPGDGLLLRVR